MKLNDLRVLLVEDDPVALDLTAQALEERVERVYQASNGEEGWTLFRMLRPDLVISDIRMPGMDGMMFAQKIKALNPSQPIFFLSAFNDRETLMKAMELSVDSFVLKPLDMEELFKRIEKVMAKYHHAEEKHSHLVRRAQKLEGIAYFDELTGIPNRFAFKEELKRSIKRARKKRGGFTLLYLDLNGLKEVNDRLGHRAGDQYLVEFSKRLLSVVDRGFFARIGGDEFVLILEHIEQCSMLQDFARRLAEALSRSCEIENGERIRLSCSIGVARYPENGTSEEELLQDADWAMYRAKRTRSSGAKWARWAHLVCAGE